MWIGSAECPKFDMFGCIPRLSQRGGGGSFLVQMISTSLPSRRGSRGGSRHPVDLGYLLEVRTSDYLVCKHIFSIDTFLPIFLGWYCHVIFWKELATLPQLKMLYSIPASLNLGSLRSMVWSSMLMWLSSHEQNTGGCFWVRASCTPATVLNIYVLYIEFICYITRHEIDNYIFIGSNIYIS